MLEVPEAVGCQLRPVLIWLTQQKAPVAELLCNSRDKPDMLWSPCHACMARCWPARSVQSHLGVLLRLRVVICNLALADPDV